LDIDRAWAFDDATGAGIDVAVVDSGNDPTHPAVGSVTSGLALSWDALNEDVVLEAGPHEDLYGHGTACAGIIRRVAPECRLHSIRVLGERLSGKGPVFAAGLAHAITVARVVNLSLSTSRPEYRTLFYEIADEAAFRGVVLVCAVNNAPAPSYPSQFSSVLSVAANDGTDPYDVDCNPSPPVEFGAPGIGVTVPWLNGGTILTTGNSYAAPHITGLVARLLSKHPQLTPYQVKTVLRQVSRNAQQTQQHDGRPSQ
jgi:subtilisin family serine protease